MSLLNFFKESLIPSFGGTGIEKVGQFTTSVETAFDFKTKIKDQAGKLTLGKMYRSINDSHLSSFKLEIEKPIDCSKANLDFYRVETDKMTYEELMEFVDQQVKGKVDLRQHTLRVINKTLIDNHVAVEAARTTGDPNFIDKDQKVVDLMRDRGIVVLPFRNKLVPGSLSQYPLMTLGYFNCQWDLHYQFVLHRHGSYIHEKTNSKVVAKTIVPVLWK